MYSTVEDAVVQVFASLRLPNPMRPWAKQNPVEVMGTGVIIDGHTGRNGSPWDRSRRFMSTGSPA